MKLKRTFLFCATFGILAAGTMPSASASANFIAQWDFNNAVASDNATASVNMLGTSSGRAGTAAGYGQGNPPVPFGSVLTTGSPVDSGISFNDGTRNLGITVTPPLTSAASNAVGVSFRVSTADIAPGVPVQITWSQTVGWRSSRYWQILATTDGVNFSPVANGTGSSISTSINGYEIDEPAVPFVSAATFAPISGSGSVIVSDSGLIDFRTINQNNLGVSNVPDAGYVNGISFTFPLGQGYENNPDFGFAIVGAFDPSYLGAAGTEGLVSSVFGLDSSDAVNGYDRSVGVGGSMRLDMVTVIPEPSTYAAILGALGLMVVLIRRRRQ
jgi:hypothetical protein